MRYLSTVSILTVLTLSSLTMLVHANQQGEHHTIPPVTGSNELEKLKALTGTWRGTTVMDGKVVPVTVTYKTSSNGSIVVETLFPGTPQEMVSVYYDVNGRLGVTHYCALDNQPHFTLKGSSDKEIGLAFANGTNLNPAKDSYMHDVSFEFKDNNDMVQEWTYYENGKEKGVSTFTLSRAQQ
jgi:hypothetical protein